MEIYSRATGGETLHITQGNEPPLEGWGIDGLSAILTTLEHQGIDPVLQLYADIESALLGDYDVRADLTTDDVKNLRFHVNGRVYYYWNRFDYYECQRLPNQRVNSPDEEEGPDVDLQSLSAIEAELRVVDTMRVVFQRTQRRMCDLGLGSRFQTIVDTWNHAVETYDFRAFIDGLGSMLPAVLRAIAATHPTVSADDNLSIISDENVLLKLAIRGRRTDEDAGWNAGEAFAYLIGDLENLHRFQQVENLLTGDTQIVHGYETVDRRPILFWDFLFEFDSFLTGLLDCVVQFGRAV